MKKILFIVLLFSLSYLPISPAKSNEIVILIPIALLGLVILSGCAWFRYLKKKQVETLSEHEQLRNQSMSLDELNKGKAQLQPSESDGNLKYKDFNNFFGLYKSKKIKTNLMYESSV